MAASLEGCERPHDPGCADVESLQRRRRLPGVPPLGRPQPLRVVRGVSVGHDALDLATYPAFVPRTVGQRVEGLGLVEHATRLDAAAPRVGTGLRDLVRQLLDRVDERLEDRQLSRAVLDSPCQ
jgi:hypothetical protein